MPQLPDPGHEIISGTIGMGKSFWVLFKIIQSFFANRPLCYIDPKGDTYRAILAWFSSTSKGREVWEKMRHRIILVNPISKSDQIVGFNALKPLTEFAHAMVDRTALLANSLVSHIRRQSGFELADANRMQNIMAGAIGLLAEGGRGELTLAELPLLFRTSYRFVNKRRVREDHNPFVRSLLPFVKHAGTRSFWEDQWPQWSGNARTDWPQSTLGRVFQYLFDERMRMTVCATDSATLDFNKVIRDGYWVFVNIPYPLLSDTISTVLGNILITNIFHACMQRPPGERAYRLILDEARFFNTGPLEMILETARAYNLWLTLVVQSLDQMARMKDGRIDYRLKETALNNCRYISAFHSTVDGRTYAPMFWPVTGQVVTGQRVSGDSEYLPVSAEQLRNERRLQSLKPRMVVLHDQQKGGAVRAYRTPTVKVPEIDQAALDLFEAQHLQITGKPASEVRREIEDRQTWVRNLLAGSAGVPGGFAASSGKASEPKRVHPKRQFGKW
jgi:hypothetical protein